MTFGHPRAPPLDATSNPSLFSPPTPRFLPQYLGQDVHSNLYMIHSFGQGLHSYSEVVTSENETTSFVDASLSRLPPLFFFARLGLSFPVLVRKTIQRETAFLVFPRARKDNAE